MMLLLKKYSRWIAGFILLVVLVATARYFWGGLGTQNSAGIYRTALVEAGDLSQTASANGTLNPVMLVNVGTQVSGTVEKLHVDFNDTVKKGEVLAELDTSLYEAQLKQSEAGLQSAEAAVSLAESNAKRTEDLLARQYASKQELDQVQQILKSAIAQRAVAQAQLERDKTNLAYTIIRSPVSGVVVDRQIDVGQTVAANFQTPTLFKIAEDLKRMQIDSSFAEADIGSIRVGQSLQFTVDAFPGRKFKGTVKQIRLSPTTLQNVVTYDVVVNVPNPELILLPGMTAYVNIVIAEKKNVLMVPNAALRFHPMDVVQTSKKHSKADSSISTLYLLENGVPKPITVHVGITDNRNTEIISDDIKAGDAVIVEDTRDTSTSSGSQGSSTLRMRMF